MYEIFGFSGSDSFSNLNVVDAISTIILFVFVETLWFNFCVAQSKVIVLWISSYKRLYVSFVSLMVEKMNEKFGICRILPLLCLLVLALLLFYIATLCFFFIHAKSLLLIWCVVLFMLLKDFMFKMFFKMYLDEGFTSEWFIFLF